MAVSTSTSEREGCTSFRSVCMASLSLGAPAFSPFKFAKLAVDVSISSLFVALQ